MRRVAALLWFFVLGTAHADNFGAMYFGGPQSDANQRVSAAGPVNELYVTVWAQRKADAPVALHVRTGAIAGTGDLKLELCANTTTGFSCASAWEGTLQPFAWNRIPLTTWPDSALVRASFRPASATTDLEFVGTRTNIKAPRLGLEVIPFTVIQDWNTWAEASGRFIEDDGDFQYVGAAFVPALLFEYPADDPWAPASCLDDDRHLTLGNPYFERQDVDVPPDGGASQTFLANAVRNSQGAYPNYALKYWKLGITGPADAGFDLRFRGPGVEQYGSGALPQQWVQNFCGLAGAWHTWQKAQRIEVLPRTEGLKWTVVSAGEGLSECSAAARATLSGSLGNAQVGGQKLIGKDFVFQSEINYPSQSLRDLDGDSFGDPARLDDCGNYDGTPRTAVTRVDCDDSRPDINPDAQEVCDGVDDDCDQFTDGDDPSLMLSGCERQKAECAGALHKGAQCVGGQWQSCDASNYGDWYQPIETDACDWYDNDCSGARLLEFDSPCALQLGVCQGSKRRRCPIEACDRYDYGAFYEVTESRCDGIDNDCDGQTDEACTPAIAPEVELPAAAERQCSTTGASPLVLLALAALLRRYRK